MDNKKLSMDEIEKDIIKWRRDLHKIPEVGIELPNTVKYVSSVLDELGITYKYLVDGNAIVAEIKGEKDGKVIGLRADMDGLPITEDTGLDFASKNGAMHACGHDGHTSMLLGAAKYLMSRRDEICGTVKLLFQPAEESVGGAEPMVKEGALKNPDVDAVFGLHEGNIGYGEKHGQILFRKEAIMAAADLFEITLIGDGVHAAYPHKGIDPIIAASQLVLDLNTIVSRNVPSIEPAVISISAFNAGVTYNIIPESVKLMGTVRTFNKDVQKLIKERMADICDGHARASKCKIDLKYMDGYPATINTPEFTEFAYRVAKGLFGDSAVYLKDPVMGAEDMSFFLNEVGGCYVFLVNTKEVKGKKYPHHHPRFDVDEAEFKKGALLLAEVALNYLKK